MAGQRAWLLQPTGTCQHVPLLFVFCVLLLFRLVGAVWSLIADCDETFNYWEALHLVLFAGDPKASRALQTWEYSPEFAIRSWAYILLNAAFARPLQLLGLNKTDLFYGTRCFLALGSAVVETCFIGSVCRVVNPRCAWFTFLFLVSNAGLWAASVALLPSTFTLYTTTLAMSFALEPARSQSVPASPALPSATTNRTLKATAAFASGALLGWPFALVLALPFVLEELLVYSGNVVPAGRLLSFLRARFIGLLKAGLISSVIALPILVIDTLYYGRTVLVPLNIVVYNIFSKKRGAGPELYGIEPSWFYLANLGLNAGPVVLGLALTSAPLAIAVRFLDPSRVTGRTNIPAKGHGKPHQSTRLALLLLRLAPVYLWLGLLSSQPHKEERFMFPAYSLLCFNAAVGLEIFTGIIEKYVQCLKRGSAPQESGRKGTHAGNIFALLLFLVSTTFSLLRVLGIVWSYSAPFAVMNYLFENNFALRPQFDLEYGDAIRPTELTICYGKEWHRFPNSFFLPQASSLYFIKSEFDGILPKHFAESKLSQAPVEEFATLFNSLLERFVSPNLLAVTRARHDGFNDLNLEEWNRYINASTQCALLVDSDLAGPNLESPPPHEPRFVRDSENWRQEVCLPFLDTVASKKSTTSGGGLASKLFLTLARILWMPSSIRRRAGLQYRDFCLLTNRRLTWADSDED